MCLDKPKPLQETVEQKPENCYASWTNSAHCCHRFATQYAICATSGTVNCYDKLWLWIWLCERCWCSRNNPVSNKFSFHQRISKAYGMPFTLFVWKSLSIFILYKNKGSLNEADYILQLSRIKRCYWRWSVGDTTRRQCLAIQWPNPGTASSILPTWSKFHPAVYCPANSLTSSALPSSLLQLAIMNTLASATCNPLWVQNTSYWTLGRIWFWIVFM